MMPDGHLRRVGAGLVREMVVALRHDHHDGGATAAVALAALVRGSMRQWREARSRRSCEES